MLNIKIALTAAAALVAASSLSIESVQARPAWFGPGSGPVSPYKNYKGFAQVPQQAGSHRYVPPVTNTNSYLGYPTVNLGCTGLTMCNP